MPKTASTKRKNLEHPVSIRFTTDELDDLRGMADELGLSVSSYVRMVLKKHIKALEEIQADKKQRKQQSSAE